VFDLSVATKQARHYKARGRMLPDLRGIPGCFGCALGSGTTCCGQNAGRAAWQSSFV